MLTELREKSQSFLIYVLFGVLIVVFVFFFGPQTEGCQPSGRRVEARVGWAAEIAGAELSQEEVELQLKRQAYTSRLNLSDLQGAELSQLRRDTLMQMVDVIRLEQRARGLGLAVSEDELNKFIISKDNRDFGLFAVRVGAGNTLDDYKFDYNTFKATITQGLGTSVTEYRKMVERELLVSRYLEFLTDQIQVSDAEVKAAFDRRERKWNLEFVVFDASKSDPNIAPATAAEGAAYAKAHGDEVQAYYDDNKGVYVHDKEIKVRRILFKVDPKADDAKKAEIKKKAEEILAKARAEGADFEALAREHSEGFFKNFGGDMGWKSSDNAPPEDYKAYSTLEKGKISDVQETGIGFWFVKADDIKPAINRPLDEVRDEIGTILATTNKRKTKAKADAEALLAKIKAGGASLADLAKAEAPKAPEAPEAPEDGAPKMPAPEKEQVAAKPAFKVQETGLFNDERPNWQIIPRLGKVPALAAMLDKLTAENPQPQQIFEVEDRIFVVRLKERKEPDASAFEKQSKDFVQRLRRQRQSQLLGQWQVYLFGPARLREIYQQRSQGMLMAALPPVEEDKAIKINSQAFPLPAAPAPEAGDGKAAPAQKGG